jgi:hypothetical protein
MSTQPFHKHDDRDDLLALASDVTASPASPWSSTTARDVARTLVGVAAWVSSKVGVDGMQERMALLVRHEPAWQSGLGNLPTQSDGTVDELVALIAVIATSFLFEPKKLRSAMAFWATERDVSVWQQVAAA